MPPQEQDLRRRESRLAASEQRLGRRLRDVAAREAKLRCDDEHAAPGWVYLRPER
jgi:hypothetical protein